MARFLLQFAAFLSVLVVVIFGLRAAYGTALIHPLTLFTLAYLAVLTLITYWVTARLVAVSPDNFMAAYFGGIVLRLLLSLGLVLVYLFRGGAHEGTGTYTFLGGFFLLYFLCAGFEFWAIMSNLRPFSKKQLPEK